MYEEIRNCPGCGKPVKVGHSLLYPVRGTPYCRDCETKLERKTKELEREYERDPSYSTCSSCCGSGEIKGYTCQTCGGKGKLRDSRSSYMFREDAHYYLGI